MRSLNKQKRKYRNRYEIADSFVHCDNCNSDIPVRGDRDQRWVLRGHLGYCVSTKIKTTQSRSSSQSQQQQNESSVDDSTTKMATISMITMKPLTTILALL